MPLGFSRHSNRSQQALDPLQSQSQAQRGSPSNSTTSSLPTGGDDNAYDPRNPQSQSYSQAHNETQSYIPNNISVEGDSRAYQDSAEVPPSRLQSHRYTAGYPTQSSLPLVGEPRITSSDDQLTGDSQRSFISRPPDPAAVESKKSKRGFFGFSKSSKTQDQPPPPQVQAPSSSHNNLAGLGRRISKRHKDQPPEIRSLQRNSVEGQRQQVPWQSSHSSDSQLNSPQEEDEGDGVRDPYSVQEQALDNSPASAYDPRLQGPPRPIREDQEFTVRVVEDPLMHQQQYQQQQQQQQQQQSDTQNILLQQQQLYPQQPPQQLRPGSQRPPSQLSIPVSPLVAHTDYSPPPQGPGQYHIQQALHISSATLQSRSPQNPEVVSQLSHDSPVETIEEQRPSSVQSVGQNSSNLGGIAGGQDYPSRTASVHGPRPQAQTSAMPQQSSQSSQSRKTIDNKSGQNDGRGAPPPGYTPLQASSNPLPPLPGAAQGPNYRNTSLQREYGQSGGNGEQGRSTPPLLENRELSEMEKLVLKYKKVKGLYFEKDKQVEQLQNTLANQRLSQSRTSLDDSEYATRFNRLDGAIKEIAFSIRKEWETIPAWLAPYVNQDAIKTGTKEMTAVGRACISRWIFDEIFNKSFHPGLDLQLSTELKRIEQNVRFSASPATNQEELDALTSKIVQWRLTTVDGLSYRLNPASSAQAIATFTQMAVTNLTAHLLNHLKDPSPQSIEGNATSIIELAVGIASHVPLESRDIAISYAMPGDAIQSFMKVEQALPPLDKAALHSSADIETSSTNSDGKDSGDRENDSVGKADSNRLTKKQQDKDRSKSMMPGLSQGTTNNGMSRKLNSPGGNDANEKDGKDRLGGGADGNRKVRFAGFMGVEVRGRQWLVQPPVWSLV